MVERSLDWLVLRIGERTMLRDIDDRVVAEAVSARSAMYRYGRVEHGKVSNATVNLEVVHMLRRILVRARRFWKIQLPDEPRWGRHLLKETPRRRQASIQEQISIDEARPDLTPVVRFILISGVRRAEAIIRWSQVKPEEGVITVDTKDDGIHEIPITQEIGRILDDARGNHDVFVFTYEAQHTTRSKNGSVRIRGRRYPLNGPLLHRQLSTLYKKLGIEGLTVHDLRRTSGGRMQRTEGNVSMVQDHLDHADISTTKRVYAHIPTEDRRRAMERTTKRYDKLRAQVEAQRAV
jgi:integrase